MKKSSELVVRCILFILYTAIAATVVLFFFVPWLVLVRLDWYFIHPVPSFIFLYIGGLLAIWMMVEFILIMHTVKTGNPFVPRNVTSLAHISICAGACAADIAFMLIFFRSIPLLLCIMIFVFGCLTAAVLASVFREAVRFKQENDLTI